MKKILLILLCLPLIGFGQVNNISICAFESILETGEKIYYEAECIKDSMLYLNGTYIVFHNNGNKKLVGNYLKGEKDGQWEEYYEEGQLKIIRNFKFSDDLNGIYKAFREDGKLLREGSYINNKRNGFWTDFWKSTGSFDNVFLISETGDPNSKHREGFYLNGSKEGWWDYYINDTIDISWKFERNNTIRGIRRYFFNGNIKEELLFENFPTENWDEITNLIVIDTSFRTIGGYPMTINLSGEKMLSKKCWDITGFEIDCITENDTSDYIILKELPKIIFKVFFDNYGNISSAGRYDQDEFKKYNKYDEWIDNKTQENIAKYARVGIWREFYESGNLFLIANYKYFKEGNWDLFTPGYYPDGLMITYFENGKINWKEMYKNGNRIWYEEWSEDGQLIHFYKKTD